MKKLTFDIALNYADGHQEMRPVSGYEVLPGLAADRRSYFCWVLTHISSGLAVRKFIKTRRGAIEWAQEHSAIDWTQDKETARRAYKRIYESPAAGNMQGEAE